MPNKTLQPAAHLGYTTDCIFERIEYGTVKRPRFSYKNKSEKY